MSLSVVARLWRFVSILDVQYIPQCDQIWPIAKLVNKSRRNNKCLQTPANKQNSLRRQQFLDNNFAQESEIVAKRTERPFGNSLFGQLCPEIRKRHQSNRAIDRQQFSGNNVAQRSENVVKTTRRSFGYSLRATISPRNPKPSSRRRGDHSATVFGQQFRPESETIIKTTDRSFGNSLRATILSRNPKMSPKQRNDHSATISPYGEPR